MQPDKRLCVSGGLEKSYVGVLLQEHRYVGLYRLKNTVNKYLCQLRPAIQVSVSESLLV